MQRGAHPTWRKCDRCRPPGPSPQPIGPPMSIGGQAIAPPVSIGLRHGPAPANETHSHPQTRTRMIRIRGPTGETAAAGGGDTPHIPPAFLTLGPQGPRTPQERPGCRGATYPSPYPRSAHVARSCPPQRHSLRPSLSAPALDGLHNGPAVLPATQGLPVQLGKLSVRSGALHGRYLRALVEEVLRGADGVRRHDRGATCTGAQLQGAHEGNHVPHPVSPVLTTRDYGLGPSPAMPLWLDSGPAGGRSPPSGYGGLGNPPDALSGRSGGSERQRPVRTRLPGQFWRIATTQGLCPRGRW